MEFSKRFKRDEQNNFSYNGASSQDCVHKSTSLSPPNLASPRFGMANTQESGTASLTNVIRFVEAQNDLRFGNSENSNLFHRDSRKLKNKQVSGKPKRKRGPTPKTSPRRPKVKKPKRVKLESTHELITAEDGTVCLESFLALKVGQLRKLSEELELNLPAKLRKKELRRRISEVLNIQSRKNSPKIAHTSMKPEYEDKCLPWSPPRIVEISSPLSPIIIKNANPEEGVRIMKVSEVEAYEDDICLRRNNKELI